MMSQLGETLSPVEIEEMIKEADLNRNGTIDFEEFVILFKH